MLCNELTNALTRLATRIAKVCCDRQLLVYSANLVILAVVFVRHEIFLARLFCAASPAALADNCAPLLAPP